MSWLVIGMHLYGLLSYHLPLTSLFVPPSSQLDMNNLKSDPRFREKYKDLLRDKEGADSKPQTSPVSTFYSRMMNRIRPKDGEW